MEWRRAAGCGLVVGERVCGSPVFAPVTCGQHARVLGHGELASLLGSAARLTNCCGGISIARLAQSAERKALNLVVVGSSPTVGAAALCLCFRAVGICHLNQAGLPLMWSVQLQGH